MYLVDCGQPEIGVLVVRAGRDNNRAGKWVEIVNSSRSRGFVVQDNCAARVTGKG
jgi:hypothetical protein